jgi:hypothetical protein
VERKEDRKAVAGARVTLRSPENGWVQSLETGGKGEFRFPLVPAGGYDLTVSAPGMSSRRLRGVKVNLGSTRDQVIPLEPSEASAVVEVVGASSDVDVVQTSLATIHTSDFIDQLPLGSRNLSDLLLISPGAGSPNPGMVTVDGARATQNHVMVDGLTITSAYSGYPLGVLSSSFLFSLGTVQEVQVLNLAFDVQFGEAIGAIVNALTRSGTNQFHGQVLVQDRPEWLAARMRPVDSDPYGTTNAPRNLDRHLSFRTLNAVLGGPILADRAHYLIGMERFTRQQSFLPGVPVRDFDGYRASDLETWKQALGSRLVVGPGHQTWAEDISQPYLCRDRNDALFAKVDLRLGAGHNLAVRWNATDWQTVDGWGSSYQGQSNLLDQQDVTRSVVFELQSILGSDAIHELRAQVASERYRAGASTGSGPEFDIGPLFTGTNAYAPQHFSERILQLNEGTRPPPTRSSTSSPSGCGRAPTGSASGSGRCSCRSTCRTCSPRASTSSSGCAGHGRPGMHPSSPTRP